MGSSPYQTGQVAFLYRRSPTSENLLMSCTRDLIVCKRSRTFCVIKCRVIRLAHVPPPPHFVMLWAAFLPCGGMFFERCPNVIGCKRRHGAIRSSAPSVPRCHVKALMNSLGQQRAAAFSCRPLRSPDRRPFRETCLPAVSGFLTWFAGHRVTR